MKIRNKIKTYTQAFLAIFSVSILVLPQMSSVVTVVHSEPVEKQSAEERKKDEDKKKEDFRKSVKDAGYGSDLMGDLDKAKESGLITEKNTVPEYINYLLLPGFYIEDVNNYVEVSEDGVKTDNTVAHKKDNGRYSVCFHNNEPQNLLNHNCDIPSFGTELFQQMTKSFDATGIRNSGKTSAYAGALGFGVPAGIPNENVPVNPAERTVKYTALEIFGYNLEFTSYTGEYDNIMTSSEARLLANVGFWGKVKLGGSAILKGITNVFNKWVEGWIFNPSKWGSKSPGFVDGVVSTVIDTSDYNLTAQHAWKRPEFSKTLYNVHYMSDKEVIEKAQEDFKKFIQENLFKEIEKDPDAKEVLYLMPDGEYWPVFTFDPTMYTEESKKAVEKWEKCNAKPEKVDKKGKKIPKKCGPKPELVVVPEEEQFSIWKKTDTVKAYDARAKKQGIDCYEKSKLFPDVYKCWAQPFDGYAKKTLNHDNPVLQFALKAIERRFLEDNPYADPNRGLSHYVCADEEGKPIGNTKSSWKYYYTAENTREEEFVNSGCSPVRPSIEGAKFGTGDGESTDDRYKYFTQNKKPQGVGAIGGLSRSIARFTAKITNTLISLSYENIVSYLGLDTIIETSFNTFRDSIFFPFSVILIAISGIYILLQAVKAGGNPWKTAGILILTYMLCTVALYSTGKILKLVEEVPNHIDKLLMEAVLSTNESAPYCKGGGESSEVRQAQCAVWDITVFQPWIRGQFGAPYSSLNDNKMQHTNRDLVGSPDVNMGGGHIEKNWALWQLSKTKSGTITTPDPKDTTGYESKALYKLVDLQLGPNYSAGRDTRFITTWSGIDSNRSGIMFYSGFIGTAILIVVGSLCIAKIEMTFKLLLKVVFLPVFFLKGLHPNGQSKITEYLSDIIGIFIKRIFVVLLMTITLNTCISIGNSSTNYNIIGIFTIAFLVAVILYWKEIIHIINNSSAQIGNMRNKANISQYMPKDMALKYSILKAKLSTAIPGAIGGAIGAATEYKAMKKEGLKIDGNVLLEGAKYGSGKMGARFSSMAERKQRRAGFGILRQFKDAKQAGESKTVANMLLKPTNQQKYDVKQVYNIINNKKREYEVARDEILAEKDKVGLSEEKLNKLDFLNNSISQIDTTLSYLHNATGDNWESTKEWKSSGNQEIDKIILSVKLERTVLFDKDNKEIINNFNLDEDLNIINDNKEEVINSINDNKIFKDPLDVDNNKTSKIYKELTPTEEAEYLIHRINNADKKAKYNTKEADKKAKELEDKRNNSKFYKKKEQFKQDIESVINEISEPIDNFKSSVKDLVDEINNTKDDYTKKVEDKFGITDKKTEKFNQEKEVYNILNDETSVPNNDSLDIFGLSNNDLKNIGAGSTTASSLRKSLQDETDKDIMSKYMSEENEDKNYENYLEYKKNSKKQSKESEDSYKEDGGKSIKVTYTEEKKEDLRKDFINKYSNTDSAKANREKAYQKAADERKENIKSKMKALMSMGTDFELDENINSYKVKRDEKGQESKLTSKDYKQERNDPVIDNILDELYNTSYKTKKENNSLRNKIKNTLRKGGDNNE